MRGHTGLYLRLLQAIEAEEMIETAPDSLLRAGIDPPDGCGLAPYPHSSDSELWAVAT